MVFWEFVQSTHSYVRIWDTRTYIELVKLAHVQNVISVAWMENDSGVVSLGELGDISLWKKMVCSPFLVEVRCLEAEWELVKPTGGWAWARMLDASDEFPPGDRPTCFAYLKDRIAVAYPQIGVKVWLWVNGEFRQPGVPAP